MISVGDRVMFSRKFCRSIGAPTGFFPFAVGTVTFTNERLVKVLWDGEDEPKGVLAINLIRQDQRHLEPN